VSSSADPIPIVGVSLGHVYQPTGLGVIERIYKGTGEMYTAPGYDGRGLARYEAREKVELQYHVRHLERLGPPTRYSKIATRIPEIVREIGRDLVFVVDITAAGRPAYARIYEELQPVLKDRGLHLTVCPITVTGVAGGVTRSPDNTGFLVPRRDLISATHIAFDDAKLKIAEGLSLTGMLTDELTSFKEKAKKPSDDLDGWREGKNDDLVLAVAVAIWACERFLIKEESRPAGEFLRVPH
jgi:hypothetical protein